LDCAFKKLLYKSYAIRTTSYPIYELQNVNILRQIRVSKMSPQILILLRSTTNEHQFFTEK